MLSALQGPRNEVGNSEMRIKPREIALAPADVPEQVFDPNKVPLNEDGTLRMLTEDEMNEAWEALQNSPSKGFLDRAKWEAKETFGRMLAVRLNPDIVGLNLVEASELLQSSLRAATALANSSRASKKVQIAAIEAVTMAARAQGELCSQILKVYRANRREERAARKEAKNIGPSAEMPMIVANNVQINPAPQQANSGAEPKISDLPIS